MKQNSLILLDIDQTLIDSMSLEKYNENKDLIIRPPDYVNKSLNLCIWERTGLGKFIKYLDRNFRFLGIWTNGTEMWLYLVLNTILKKYVNKNRFVILFSNKESQILFRKTIIDNEMYMEKVLIKDLNSIFKRSKFTKKNTIIIDDNYDNCMKNKNNSLPIKRFSIINSPNENFEKKINIIEGVKKSNNYNYILNKVYLSIKNYDNLFTKTR